MNIRLLASYIIVAMLGVLSYITVRSSLIYPIPDDIVISNLTLTLVLLIMIVGGVCPWIARKLFPHIRQIQWTFTLIVGLLVILLLGATGYKLKSGTALYFGVVIVLALCYSAFLVLYSRKGKSSC